jgi:hypothetical protein
MEATRTRLRLTAALLAAMTLVMMLVAAQPAHAQGASWTSGSFTTTAVGTDRGYDIEGRASMLRVSIGGDGLTIVSVRVTGLDPATTFAAHVHNGTCASGGGSHYQHVVGGAVDAVNEIWPTITTNPQGRGHGFATHGHLARPDARSVVIHASDGARLACADLS